MIVVANISRFREMWKQQTIIIPNGANLHDNEVVEIEKILGKFTLAAYVNWAITRGSHPVTFIEQNNLVFICANKSSGNYSGDILADAMANVMDERPQHQNQFVTRNDLFMIGLPGNGPQERERARQDLTRWYSPQNITKKLTILCNESE